MPMVHRSSNRIQAAAPGTRRPSLLYRLLHPSEGAPSTSHHTSTRKSGLLFGRKRKSHTPIISSNSNAPTLGLGTNPITGNKKSRPLFGRKKRTGPAAILNPNHSARHESVGEKFNRVVSGGKRNAGKGPNIMPGTTGRTRRRRFF
jgi:hypothetical protein